MVARPRLSVVAAALWAMLAAGPLVARQDALAHAKDLYASANYDEALKALEAIPRDGASSTVTADIDEYRIFCLLALGRTQDAEALIGQVVRADPTYRLSDTTASPRIRAVFDGVRRSILPDIVRDAYARAREAYDRKDMATAAAGFDRVLTLLDDPGMADVPGLNDLGTLATGFRDLSKAAAQAAAQAAAAAAAAKPAVTAAAQPAPPPPPPPPAPERTVFGPDDADVTPPVAKSRPIPAYHPTSTFERRQDVTGALEIIVDEKGNVSSAVMRKSISIPYDATLVAAAKQWKFDPAKRNGVPVKFLYVMQIHIAPS